MIAAKLYGLYDRDEEQVDRSRADDLIGVFILVTVGSWLVFAFTRLTGLANPTSDRLLLFWAGAIVRHRASRASSRALDLQATRQLSRTRSIVGAGEVGQLVARKLLEHPEYGVNVVGFVDSDPREHDDVSAI